MEAGRPARDVARELGVTDQTLYNAGRSLRARPCLLRAAVQE